MSQKRSLHLSLILSTLLLLPALVTGISSVATFQLTSLNLASVSGSYQIAESPDTPTDMQCVQRAGKTASVQLATFQDGECKLYSCSSCALKCRIINSGGSDSAWIRSSHLAACWVTVQHRVSGSVNFYRNWADYKTGFGEGENGNFWIGLDTIHSLTLSGKTMRIELTLWNDTVYWAQMTNFSLGPESGNYTMAWSSYSGTLKNSMNMHMHKPFSTKDRNNCNCADNDNCAVQNVGAWWFDCCHLSNLNGQYYNYSAAVFATLSGRGITWINQFTIKYSMKEAEMLIK